MNLTEAENLARRLMDEHGVSEYWDFAWSSSRQKYGMTRRTWRRGVYAQEIVLSKPLTEVCDDAKVVDTVLHEIAHAIVGVDQGHNQAWKDKCIELGAEPEATYAGQEDAARVSRYTYHCSIDDAVLLVSQRRLSTVGRECKEHGAGLLRKRIIDGQRVQDLDYVNEV